jgi:uroporphyrinogen-III synthase
MPRALVTRPAPLAARTARRLQETGFEAIVLPLSETKAIAVDPSLIPAAAGSIAVTSANALLNAPGGLIRGLAGIPCHAVGRATGATARAAGFRSVIEGPGDAAGLARLLATSGGAAPVVYLCGRVRRPDFEATLAAAGTGVIAVETYDTVSIRPDVGHASAVIGRQPLAAALVYSASAADALLELAEHPDLAGRFQDTAFCCLSPRIAARLVPGVDRKILVATEPTEEALLSLLAKPA